MQFTSLAIKISRTQTKATHNTNLTKNNLQKFKIDVCKKRVKKFKEVNDKASK